MISADDGRMSTEPNRTLLRSHGQLDDLRFEKLAVTADGSLDEVDDAFAQRLKRSVRRA